MRLLLVEDNVQLASRIVNHVPDGYGVRVVHSGTEALAAVRRYGYGLVVLDLGLPDMTGLEVCRTIRKEGHGMPILILTAVDSVASRVELLGSGADDYLTKPFDSRELTARIEALARRPPLAPLEEDITVGDLTLNCAARSATRSGVRIPLRRKEYAILEYLLRHPGRVVTRQMILNHVWDTGGRSGANTVDVHIKNLRDLIDRPFAEPLIKTAYGIGYQVEVPEEVTTERGAHHD